MEQHITADRIANSIMQDRRFNGLFLLVEGSKDLKVYTKFFCKEGIKLVQTWGKYKQRDVYKLLTERGFTKKIAIRDADFLRIPGNQKYDAAFIDQIFVTDGHDSEVMMILNEALEDMLAVSVNTERLQEFEGRIKETVKQRVFNLAYPIGCLRLANRKYELGLSFKPEAPKGGRVKFKKFVCNKQFSIDVEQMIHIVSEYSKNRNKIVKSKPEILEALKLVMAEELPIEEIVNGHDVAEIICILASDGMNSKSHVFDHPDNVEESLALSFDRAKFAKTQLYTKIELWKNAAYNEAVFSN